MQWFETADIALFRLINQGLSHRWLDAVMPLLSWNPLFVPVALLLAAGLIWKGGCRGRLCVGFVLLGLLVGDSLLASALKKSIQRPRPFETIDGTRLRVGKGRTASMPSAHATNWAMGTLVAFIYYRRSLRWMLPAACAVGFSRVYNGVHYPSDVLAGLVLGAATGAGLVYGLDAAWRQLGGRWFPHWHARLPSLADPAPGPAPAAPVEGGVAAAQWLRLGYVWIAVVLGARLIYLAGGKIELSEDEAYQWLWSKHLALSYYSKPPLIAYTQFLGTAIWGDNEFGVRFFSPVLAALASILLLRFLAAEAGARMAFGFVVAVPAVPLLAVGSILMTVDPLSVFFWTLALLSGWRAIHRDSTAPWLWTGLWMGLGFLSKYTALFQLLCWAVFFAVWNPARRHLARPGPYLALGILALCSVPVLLWNARHGWVTVAHVAGNASLDQAWRPTARYFFDFFGAETALLNPIFFPAMILAAMGLWRREDRRPLPVFLFCMGAPLFLIYASYTFRSRVHPNWIAPSVLPLLMLAGVYWGQGQRLGRPWVRRLLGAGIGLGLVLVILLHDTNLVEKISGRALPARVDPLRRVRGWKSLAHEVGDARRALSSAGRPVFIIGDHYGITSLITFYLPEARAAAANGRPLVFVESSDRPKNQFFFWSGYRQWYLGADALFVQQVRAPEPPPRRLVAEFESVRDLGTREIEYRKRVFHTIQLFECRGLK